MGDAAVAGFWHDEKFVDVQDRSAKFVAPIGDQNCVPARDGPLFDEQDCAARRLGKQQLNRGGETARIDGRRGGSSSKSACIMASTGPAGRSRVRGTKFKSSMLFGERGRRFVRTRNVVRRLSRKAAGRLGWAGVLFRCVAGR